MKIIQQRERVEGVEYSQEYAYREGDYNLDGGGFSFTCDENGNVDRESLNPCARANLDRCLSGELYDVGINERPWSYRTDRIGKCGCGEEVVLNNFTNTCHGCGADYNMSGDCLAPRSQWGAETGEHWTDCY